MVRSGIGVCFAFLWILGGCRAEKFVSPDKPDLYKVPYDFAPAGDSAGVEVADLNATAHDLASPDDLDERD